jgi:hypothetical protein
VFHRALILGLLIVALPIIGTYPMNATAQGRTAADASAAFQEAGFPISEVAVYDENTDRLFRR